MCPRCRGETVWELQACQWCGLATARASVAGEREDRQIDIPPGGVKLYAGVGGLLVVGSANYAAAVNWSVGPIGPQGVSMTASLVHEPSNPYDSNAISVCLEGQVIGHLQRQVAQEYRPVMDALAQRGLTAYCRCDIRPDVDPQYLFHVHVYVDTPQRQLDLLAKTR